MSPTLIAILENGVIALGAGIVVYTQTHDVTAAVSATLAALGVAAKPTSLIADKLVKK